MCDQCDGVHEEEFDLQKIVSNYDKKKTAIAREHLEKIIGPDSFRPVLFFYRNQELSALCHQREYEDEDDQRMAFLEMSMLGSFLGAQEIGLAFDVISPTDEEAVAFFIVSQETTIGTIMPYARDDEEKFTSWIDEDGKDSGPPPFGGYMLITIMQFMRQKRQTPYSNVIINTLVKRGHDVTIFSHHDNFYDWALEV